MKNLVTESGVKRIALAVGLIAIAATFGYTQFRADVGVDLPWSVGIQLSDGLGGENESVDVLSQFVFLLPDIMLSYEADLGFLSIGAGARIFSLILISMAYPIVYAEAEVGPVAIQFNVGGGAFLFFGLVNHFETGRIVTPELSAHFKLGKSFRAGVGVMGLLGLETEQQVFPYILYLSAKWVIRS